ncbi:MAG: hypothetical protein CTY22_11925 [Methylomonas sp.]|nr:MAG: hypothetical protein CTY22_11925 [Methylomonas sp.]
MAGLILSFSVVSADPVGLHGGDIHPIKSGNVLTVAKSIFTGDFGDLPGGAFSTSNPGFDLNRTSGAFGANNLLWFEGLGSLRFWNGSAWVNNTTAGESVRFVDALDRFTTFRSTGISNPHGIIGQIDSNGALHSHLPFSVRTESDSLGGSVGAYWIAMRLLETTLATDSEGNHLPPGAANIVATSNPFNIVFNRGLIGTAFSTAVAAVPVPAAVWLFGSALAAVAGLGRRRSRSLNKA